MTWDDLPLMLTVCEAARVLRVHPNCVYDMVRRHQVAHEHLGRAIRIPRDDLRRGAKPNHTHSIDPATVAVPARPLRVAPRRGKVTTAAGR